MSRIEIVNQGKETKKICYIMYNSFRLQQNHAIQYGLDQAQPFDILMFHIREQNPKQNEFLLEGIKNYTEVSVSGIESILFYEDEAQLIEHAKDYSHVVFDQPYLEEERAFVHTIQSTLSKKNTVIYVESNVMVPVKVASNKEEYAARTIRKKIWNKVHDYSNLIPETNIFLYYELIARNEFIDYVEDRMKNYGLKNDPSTNYTSRMSAYLKYGFISPVYMYNVLQSYNGINVESYVEELIVRRELSYNFVYYNQKYNDFHSMTYGWAYLTMDIHGLDKREYIYTLEDYIKQKTHDPYFNKAMSNMIHNGYMHGYMRMYWCKKIIEWSSNYEQAYEIAIYLNNYYFLDGNSPNGYAGVAWCFGKHDRAWGERSIFGKIRYMNQKGLERKFDMESYLKK